jgi:hypothetical protein
MQRLWTDFYFFECCCPKMQRLWTDFYFFELLLSKPALPSDSFQLF